MKKNDELEVKSNKAEAVENKKPVLTDDELEGVSGGFGRTPEATGFPCPACNSFIPVSMYQIMASPLIHCPTCGICIEIPKRSASLPDIDSLTKDLSE